MLTSPRAARNHSSTTWTAAAKPSRASPTYRHTEVSGDGFNAFAPTSLLPKTGFEVHVAKRRTIKNSPKPRVQGRRLGVTGSG